MYAIIETGGKQYRVQEGDVIEVELLSESSSSVSFDQVLFVHNGNEGFVGAPHVANYVVLGEILGQSKGPKVKSIKYKRRKNSYRRIGHRQKYSQVKITGIKQG